MKHRLFLTLSTFLLLFCLSANAIAQRTITGKVIDDNKDPLIGASVLVKGTANGTVTDFNGEFQLNVAAGQHTLVVSYTGYETKEVKLKSNENRVEVELKVSSAQLDEVVVTGYQVPLVQQDNTIQGATITSEEIKNLPTRNINALNATTAGLATSKKERKRAKVRGSRSNATDYYVDGIRVSSQPIPKDTQDKEDLSNESYDNIRENSFKNVQAEPVSTFSIDVDGASYANLRRYINHGSIPPSDAIRIEEMINYFDYDYSGPMNGDPFEVITEYSDCPWNKDHKLLHIGLQGMEISNDNLPSSNLVFLIDVSGSMGAANKLPLLKASFKLLVNQLRPQDRVSIVVYAGAAGMVLPPTSGSNKNAIMEALDKLQSGGSTAGGAGIQLAYKTARDNFMEGGNNRVILATDGDFNVGVSGDGELVRMIEKERESGVFLTVLGFGMGNYKDSKMQKLANKGNGNHAYIDQLQEAKKVLVEEFGGTVFTIAKDVKLQLEFNPAQVKGYRLIGYENRLLNREDFDDDTKDAGELGAGHTVTALYEIIPNGVESSFLAGNSDLKYQEVQPKSATNQKDLMTLKLRYKPKNGKKSKLITHVVDANAISLKKASDNFRWSAAVAAFGLVLRDSEYKQEATFKTASDLAKAAKGKDTNGYRQEMIDLIQKAKSLKDAITAEK